MTWLLSMLEVAEQLDKTPGATKVWLHRHCIKATKRVSVEAGAHRALYAGDQVKVHQASEVTTCPGCVTARRRPASR